MKKKKSIGELLSVLQSIQMPELDALEKNEDDDIQISNMFDSTSYINEVKDYHSQLIKRTKRFMDENLEILSTVPQKGPLQKKEIKKYKRNLYKHWKEIECADHEVMKGVNEILNSRMVIELYLDDKKKGKLRLNKQIFMPPLDNIGFSKDDGYYSEQPHGKISLPFQVEIFTLIKNMLNLHNAIESFLFYQANIINFFDPDSGRKSLDIIHFLIQTHSNKLERKECLKIIKEELEKEGIYNYSESYILKQLSNWNVYNPSDKEKNKKQKRTKPLAGYKYATTGTDISFREWVKNTYLPYYRRRKTTRSISSRINDPYDENNEEHNSEPASEDEHDNY